MESLTGPPGSAVLNVGESPLQKHVAFIVYLYVDNEKLVSLALPEKFECNVMFLSRAILISQVL